MATREFQVGASGDDGYSYDDALGVWEPSANGVFIGNISGDPMDAWLRFTSCPIPQGAKINTAHLILEARNDQSGTTCTVRIYFNDADDAEAPYNASNHASKDRTTAFTEWSPGAWLTDDVVQSPDISGALQEVVNRGGYSSGNDIMVLIDDYGSDANARRNIKAYDSAPSNCAILYVRYNHKYHLILLSPVVG